MLVKFPGISFHVYLLMRFSSVPQIDGNQHLGFGRYCFVSLWRSVFRHVLVRGSAHTTTEGLFTRVAKMLLNARNATIGH